LDRFYHEGKGSDPIIHFYETFLAQYDPDEREQRGVYFTPEPVVGYIVRSLHNILKSEFNKLDGLASDNVTLLDPAAGTMTFIALASQRAVIEFESKYGHGGHEDFILNHVLKNFYAFELMMAPYAVGHLKMGFFLEELGHRLAENERMKFFLTNTLDMQELEQSRLPGFSSLAEESRLAGNVKKQTPILVILGNPPYSGHSSNVSDEICTVSKGSSYVTGWNPKSGGGAEPITRKASKTIKTRQPTFIGRLIRDYYFVDEKPLGEKNPKWLQDDYVKFLRFSQWKIEQSGNGIVGMITNHSYLDNPTFRGMRQSLMRTFDKIYILDLHGNALKKETCPDGSLDQNVFDIRQGVSIAFFIKYGTEAKANAIVYHADIFGKRESKYSWLNNHEQETTKWSKIEPRSPFYMFVPRDYELEEKYYSFPAVHEILLVNSVGIVTARDHLTISWTPEEVWKTVTVFSHMDPELARQGYNLGKDVRDWKVTLAQKDLLDSGPERKNVVPILYRPFDIRYTYYTGRSRGFICMPRQEVMRHMLSGENIALITVRRVPANKDACFFMVTNRPISNGSIRSDNQSIDYLFPLYLYPTVNCSDLFSHHEQQGRRSNLNEAVVSVLAHAYGKRPPPEDIFHYIYAVLYAQKYRDKYGEFLRTDFPRVPFTSDYTIFSELAELGKRLSEIHLLRSSELDPPICRFEGQGDCIVAKSRKEGMHYNAEEQRIYINTSQYFEPVPETIWSYHIGGYQVCDKWLKDRKERQLELDDIRIFCRIVTSLSITIEIQDQIDAFYPKVDQQTLSFSL